MKFLIFYLIAIFAILIQTTIFSFNFALILVLFACFLYPVNFSLFFAFFAGILLDFLAGGTLGFSSLAFLITTLILVLYRQRFSFRNPAVVFLSGFIADSLYNLLVGGKFLFFEGILVSLVLVALRLLVPFLFGGFEENEMKLKT